MTFLSFVDIIHSMWPLTLRPSEACEYEWGPFRRLPPPGVLSENEGEGELGGRVMELIKLGPLSILGLKTQELNITQHESEEEKA